MWIWAWARILFLWNLYRNHRLLIKMFRHRTEFRKWSKSWDWRRHSIDFVTTAIGVLVRMISPSKIVFIGICCRGTVHSGCQVRSIAQWWTVFTRSRCTLSTPWKKNRQNLKSLGCTVITHCCKKNRCAFNLFRAQGASKNYVHHEFLTFSLFFF